MDEKDEKDEKEENENDVGNHVDCFCNVCIDAYLDEKNRYDEAVAAFFNSDDDFGEITPPSIKDVIIGEHETEMEFDYDEYVRNFYGNFQDYDDVLEEQRNIYDYLSSDYHSTTEDDDISNSEDDDGNDTDRSAIPTTDADVPDDIIDQPEIEIFLILTMI